MLLVPREKKKKKAGGDLLHTSKTPKENSWKGDGTLKIKHLKNIKTVCPSYLTQANPDSSVPVGPVGSDATLHTGASGQKCPSVPFLALLLMRRCCPLLTKLLGGPRFTKLAVASCFLFLFLFILPN